MVGTDEEAVGPPDTSDSQPHFEIDDSFVAPWGLANEERPMHLLWDGDVEQVEIRFAEPIELIEAYNLEGEIEAYESTELYEDTKIRLISLDRGDLDTPGYISIKFRVPTIYDEAMFGQKIGVTFYLPNGEIREWEQYTFTIRPQIELVDAPDIVPLEDDLNTVDLKMRYIGFGMAQVAIEAEGEGELISEGESIYHDLIAALIASGLHKKESDQLEPIPDDWKQEAGVEIPQEEIEDIVQEMRNMLSEGTAFDEFESGDLHDLADVLEEGDDEYEVTPMYQHIELMLLNSILDVVDRHPTENVQLSNPHTKIEIESRMHGFVVRYRLRDNHGNEYDPVEVPIKVEDNRENGGGVEAEINTEWEHHQLDPDEILTEIMEGI